MEEIGFNGDHLGVAAEGGGVVGVGVLQVRRGLQYVRILGEPEVMIMKHFFLVFSLKFVDHSQKPMDASAVTRFYHLNCI